MKLRSLLLILLLGVLSAASSQAFVGVSINIAPPVLPVYEQPPCPVDGYLWTPGYWAYDNDSGYYWVQGVWVAPPRIGYLWTPGYWGYNDGFYAFNQGYWGPTVGFYGGVNYGYGYGGDGYYGGRWDGRSFRYNTAITRVNTRVIHNTYIDRNAVNHATNSRASFNGRGGVNARPTSAQLAARRGSHLAPTSAQTANRQKASRTLAQRGSGNRTQRNVAAGARTTGAARGNGVNHTAGRQAVHNGRITDRRFVGQGQSRQQVRGNGLVSGPRNIRQAPQPARVPAQGGHPQGGQHGGNGKQRKP